MENKKQSSVDFILNAFNLLSDSDFKAWMLNNHDEIKAMHKQEIIDAFRSGLKSPYHQDYHWHPQQNTGTKSEHYYNETFGEQDERDRSIQE